MTATAEPITQEARDAVERLLDVRDHVVIVLGSFGVLNGQPQFMVKTYGPYTEADVALKAAEIQRLEGGAVLIRPLVSWSDTIAQISAD